MRLALRIDVDTYRGTRDGLPVLRKMLHARGIQASFFLSCGPDNMGRHIRRLIRPAFRSKMLRSGAPSMYGWGIGVRGTIWPGPVIHRHLASQMKSVADDGHEIGVHAWDHYWWQTSAHSASPERMSEEMARAHEAIADVIGREPTCAAAPGWICTPDMLHLRDQFNYEYVSDCRGQGVFQPVGGPPQVSVNLPTWDEVVGRDGVTDSNFNEYLMGCLRRDGFDVLTIHAESEGGVKARLFEDFLDRALADGLNIVPLSTLVESNVPTGQLGRGVVPGREGWVAVREDTPE